VATAAAIKRPDQRIVAFSLEQSGNIERARAKMRRKNVDLMVYNQPETMGSDSIDATFLYPDGHDEPAGCRGKREMADILLRRAIALF
jgi:phosphopantothenoylcysteine synthetase/decarboxylase